MSTYRTVVVYRKYWVQAGEFEISVYTNQVTQASSLGCYTKQRYILNVPLLVPSQKVAIAQQRQQHQHEHEHQQSSKSLPHCVPAIAAMHELM